MTQAEKNDGASAPVTPLREAQAPPASPKDRSKPTRTLPSDRIAHLKQLEIARAFAIATGNDTGKVVRTSEVAGIARVHQTTVQLITPFFQDIGLIQKAAGGFIASEALVNFNRASQWNPETAAQRLAPLLRETWFAQAIVPQVELHSMNEGEALEQLGLAAGADKQHQTKIRLLLDYMDVAGVITRDGGMIRPGRVSAPLEQGAEPAEETESPATQVPAQPSQPAPRVAAMFTKDVEGGLQFSVNFRITASDFEGWDPELVSAFFAGVAQVIAAKGHMEAKEAGKT